MSDPAKRIPDWMPHVAPYVLFLLMTWAAAEISGIGTVAYPVKTVVVAAVLVWFWRRGSYPELDLRPSLLGIGAGVAGFALWVLPEGLLAGLPKLGESAYDPHAAGDAWYVPLLAFRLAGATLVVPVFEELFLRSFLIRYLDMIREDRDGWRDLPIGRYRLFSFLGVIVAMAITHHRWLRAGLWSALVTLVLYREKRLGPVIWAHAVTNLLLGVYVLKTGHWSFW